MNGCAGPGLGVPVVQFCLIFTLVDLSVVPVVQGDGARTAPNCTSASTDPNCFDINKIGQGNRDVRNRGGGDKGKSKKPDVSDKYGLVPPFLGAASGVIIIYIVVHCLYLHCYAKKKMKRMAQNSALQSPTPATIVMTDHPSSASFQQMTPLVKYEGAYGKTEVLQPQPYFMRLSAGKGQQGSTAEQSHEGSAAGPDPPQTRRIQAPPSPKAVEFIKSGAKRTSSLLSSIKSRSSKKSSSNRMSTSSIGTEASMTLAEQEQLFKNQRISLDQGIGPAIKTNVCFVPFGKTVKDMQANESSEWIPVQGYIYSPKGQENGGVNPGLSSMQSTASQIVFIPITTPIKIQPTPEETLISTTPDPPSTITPAEMEVFIEESESGSNRTEARVPLLKEPEGTREENLPSATEAAGTRGAVATDTTPSEPEPSSTTPTAVTVEVHTDPTPSGD